MGGTRGRLLALLVGFVLLSASTGCVSLEPAFLPERVLDEGSGNGWVLDAGRTRSVEGGALSKTAVMAYEDDASDDRGYTGVLAIVSLRGLLSPDREALRERAEEALVEEAERNGLQPTGSRVEGERTLANGALSFYVALDAEARDEDSVFTRDSTVKMIGEVFRCTGGATVVVTGSAQINAVRSIQGIPVTEAPDALTWAEIVQDPSGSIEDHAGPRGLIYNVACG